MKRVLLHFVFLEHVSFVKIKELPKPVYLADRWKASIFWQRGEMSYSLRKSETPVGSGVKPREVILCKILRKSVRP